MNLAEERTNPVRTMLILNYLEISAEFLYYKEIYFLIYVYTPFIWYFFLV